MYYLEIWVLTRMSDPITVAWESALNRKEFLIPGNIVYIRKLLVLVGAIALSVKKKNKPITSISTHTPRVPLGRSPAKISKQTNPTGFIHSVSCSDTFLAQSYRSAWQAGRGPQLTWLPLPRWFTLGHMNLKLKQRWLPFCAAEKVKEASRICKASWAM